MRHTIIYRKLVLGMAVEPVLLHVHGFQTKRIRYEYYAIRQIHCLLRDSLSPHQEDEGISERSDSH